MFDNIPHFLTIIHASNIIKPTSQFQFQEMFGVKMLSTTTKDRIIQTAVRLFEIYGYHRVSVDQIVKETGTSKGGFYHNFKSKDELLFAIHDFCITYVLEKGEEAYDTYDTNTERLYNIVKSFILIYENYRSYLTVNNEEIMSLSPEHFQIIRKKQDKYRHMILDIINGGIENGEFRQEIIPEIITMSIFGMINWIYKWYNPDGKYTLEQLHQIYGDFILQAILKEENKKILPYQRFLLTEKSPFAHNPLPS